MSRSPALRNVLFYGTDTFSLGILRTLHRTGHEVLTVTKTSQTPVYSYCERHNLPVDLYDRNSLPFGLSRGQTLSQHVGVVASFGHLLPRRTISLPGRGFVNVHPSLIPRYRGAAPIHHTLLNGDATSGVTILEVVPRHFDIGDILHQVAVDIPVGASGAEVWEMMGSRSSDTLLEYLADPTSFVRRHQDPEKASAAPRIPPRQMRALSFICPQTQGAHQIYNISRLLGTGLWVSWNGQKLKLRTIGLCSPDCAPITAPRRPGQFWFDEGTKCLVMRCVEGLINISKIIIPFSGTSSDAMSAGRFWRGFSSRADKVFKMHYESEGLKPRKTCCRRGLDERVLESQLMKRSKSSNVL